MPYLSPIEALYYSFLTNGHLFDLDSKFTGFLSEDWELWLTHYKLLNS